MRSRQTRLPRKWLIVEGAADARELVKLPRGAGLLLLGEASANARLRRIARTRRVTVAEERRDAVRVHNLPELRKALLARTALILLSPIHATRSHPDWVPIPRLRAAAMARLGGRRLVALGGMDDARFRRIAPLGFQAWAGISAFRI